MVFFNEITQNGEKAVLFYLTKRDVRAAVDSRRVLLHLKVKTVE